MSPAACGSKLRMRWFPSRPSASDIRPSLPGSSISPLRLFEHYPESPDPLSEPGIVLIDNIDLHLHPSWQRHVMENLTACFPGVQFIATAHSPLIAQARKTQAWRFCVKRTAK